MTHTIPLDMLQSAGIGAVALLLGMFMTRKISWLQKFCIPSPVSGGIIFSLITLGIYKFCDIEVSFDGTLKDAFMLAFFTSVGFQANLKVLKSGVRSDILNAIKNYGDDLVKNVVIKYADDLTTGVISMLENHWHIQLTMDGDTN